MTTVESTSNERTANNVMRHEYRILTEAEKEQVKGIKDMGAAFVNACNAIAFAKAESYELVQARMKMEEAVFWAVKDLTR